MQWTHTLLFATFLLSSIVTVSNSANSEKCTSDSKSENCKKCCPCISATDVGKCVVTTGGIFAFIGLLGFGAAGIVAGAPAAFLMGLAAQLGVGGGIIAILQSLGASVGVAAVWAKVFALCEVTFVATSTARGDCCECPFEMKL